MPTTRRAYWLIIAALALIFGPPAAAQPKIRAPSTNNVPVQGLAYGPLNGNAIFVDADHPLPVTGGGGGGGGGGAVTAAAGSYAAGSIVDLGTGASPAANTVNWNLGRVVTALGTPLQAGGAVTVTAGPGAYASGSIVDLGSGVTPAANTTNAYLQGLASVNGAQADAVYTDQTGAAAGTQNALLKGIFSKVATTQVVRGNLANGAVPSSALGFMVGGTDGTNYRNFSTTTTGVLNVSVSTQPNGTGVQTASLPIGGFDGTNNRVLAVNTAGQVLLGANPGSVIGQVVGNAVSGTSTSQTGFPVLGFDGTNDRILATDTSGRIVLAPTSSSIVVGNVANATADAGAPVKVGGVYRTTPTTLTDGQRGDILLNTAGEQAVSAHAYTGADAINNGNLTALPNQAGAGAPTATAGWIMGLASWSRLRDMTGAGITGAGTTAVSVAPVTTSTAAPGTPVTGQGVTSIVSKAAPGNLYGFNVVASTTAGFVVDNNSTTAPATSAATTPIYCVPVAAGATVTFRSPVPIKGTVGHVLLFSTSCTVYTPVSPAAIFMQSEAP